MFQFSTSVSSTQVHVEPNLIKLPTVTKQEVVFQVLDSIDFALTEWKISVSYEFAAALLGKRLLPMIVN